MTDGLSRVHVKGLGSLADVTLEPGRLTVLIGPNGAGKSHLLRALTLAPRLRTRSLQRYVQDTVGSASDLLHYGPKHTPELELELEFQQDAEQHRYSCRLAFVAGDRLVFRDESVASRSGATATWKSDSLGSGHWESLLQDRKHDYPSARALDLWLGRMTFFHFHDTSITSALRTHARAQDDRYPRSDGSNLAAFLARLERSENESDGKAWRRINRLVNRIAPVVKALQPVVQADRCRLDWVDDQDEVFGVHQLSDGTLRAIALISALAQPTEQLPRFISIDEPKLGLHPAALGLIAELARSVSHRCQILFATQSPAFLDHFAPSETAVVERRNGATELLPLDEPTLQQWLRDYSLSELFDKGVLGGRP